MELRDVLVFQDYKISALPVDLSLGWVGKVVGKIYPGDGAYHDQDLSDAEERLKIKGC